MQHSHPIRIALLCSLRSQIHQWHLARTHVTGEGVALLTDMPRLSLLDVRGTAVRRWHLSPLERKFGVKLVHGAVLCNGNALAAAITAHPGLFVCGCAVMTGETEVPPWLIEWRQQGLLQLIQAAGAVMFEERVHWL